MDQMVRIEGMDAVKQALAQFDAKVQTKATRAGLREAGEVMQAAVAESAPLRVGAGGNSLPVGALKSDITLRVTSTGGQQMAVVEPGKLTRHVARWVEYGHRMVKGGRSSMKRGKLQGPGKQIGEVPAYPFIRPAFERSVAPAIEAFVHGLKSALTKGGNNVD